MLCSTYYLLGFRNKKIFKHYFSKERWDETREKYFNSYPLKTIPVYSFYNSQEAKWCRKCINHYQYLSKYLEYLLDEYEFRTGKEHKLSEMSEFLSKHQLMLSLKFGFKLPQLKNPQKIQLPWKNLPIKFRRKNIVDGYRAYYRDFIHSPIDAYVGTKRDVPEFLADKIDPLI